MSPGDRGNGVRFNLCLRELQLQSNTPELPENLLRKQLALFQERKVKPHRAHDSTRLIMVILGRMFFWRDALVNVQPNTFLRWHRKGFRLFWRWKSRPVGRPQIPKDLQTPQKLLVMVRRSGQISSQAPRPFTLGS